MEQFLRGKYVVITGAFGALGTTVTQAALEAGATVAGIDRADQGKAPAYPSQFLAWGGVDLCDPNAAEDAFKSIADAFGGIDALVNIAGGFRWETISTGTIETWDLLYNLNLRTTVVATKSALPHLLKRSQPEGGRIVNIGAASTSNASLGMGAYTASKSGVSRLTEALAAELKDSGITVNALLPSILDTPANRKDMPDAEFSRWVTPQQLANVILFLLSPQSASITGASIPIMGRV